MSTLCRSSDCVVLATYEMPVVHDMVASIPLQFATCTCTGFEQMLGVSQKIWTRCALYIKYICPSDTTLNGG